MQYLIVIYLAFQRNSQPGSSLQVITITILVSGHLEKDVLVGLSLLIGDGEQRQLFDSYQELLSSLPQLVLEKRMQAARVMVISPNFRRLLCRGSQGEAQLICCASVSALGGSAVPRVTHSDTADYATDAKVRQN